MKKIIVILTVVLFILSGCSQTGAVNVDNELPLGNEKQSLSPEDEDIDNEGSNEGDIEEDVNASDLKEDEELTEMAEEENKTEEDTLLPQEEVEEQKHRESENTETHEEETEGEGVQVEYTVLESFETHLPESINIDIQYNKYPVSYDYFLVLGANINIREKPTTESKVINKALVFEKLNLLERVKGQYLERYKSDIWYKVFWKKGDQVEYGYVFGLLGVPRNFQFEKMEKVVNNLKNEVDNNKTAYVSNYKNRNGVAPLYNNSETVDEYGIKRYQAAPAYNEANTDAPFRYIADGTLVTILEKNDKFYKIRTLNFEGEYWVPRKYITLYNSINELKQAIVVDRNNQNQGVFEYRDGKWSLISHTYATTGEKAKYKEETSLGYYMAIQTRDRFLYLDDETREIAGYAPYAIRFNGGAYIHGVPVEFEIIEDERVDPGMKEYLYTIGTVPRSHKCVRNYTSHAEFLYNWVEIGKSAVIIIE